jgi:DNA-directed RNA polymerase subunit RPC12/RpoP
MEKCCKCNGEVIPVEMTKGRLPSKCPNCGEMDEFQELYEWKDFDLESETRDADCKKCGTKFFEIYNVVGWEKL